MVVAFGACGGKSSVVSATDFNSAISAGNDVTILDVRTPEEYSMGHIAKAKNVNVYASDFENQINLLDKSKSVYVYCKSGSRSAEASAKIAKLGFNVTDLDGGLLAWSNEKLPLEGVKQVKNNGYTLNSYNEFIAANTVVLVDFYADWCGPCRMMAPHIAKMKKKYGEELKILKVDTDKSPAISQHFNITGIPLVKLYANGEEVYNKVGYHDENQLTELLEKHL